MKPVRPICQAISHRDPLKPVARDKSIRGERDLPYLFFLFRRKKRTERARENCVTTALGNRSERNNVTGLFM